ncbi:MAG: hypothetical protein C0469_17280 [Cyanobacteria bacterium DS2.3.42]|nr:hypothetical protein [Cyanobacteria bacterium DS2.3.42]
MQTNKLKRPKNLIFYYCFICVLIGCVEAEMNRKLFEQEQPKDVEVEAIVPSPASAPVQTVTSPQEAETWDACPTKPRVLAAIASFQKLISETQKLVLAFNNEGDAEERKFRFRLEQWKNEASDLRIKNDTLLKNCTWLLGATGVQAIPEIPLALENLQRAEVWLGRSIHSIQAGKFKEATDYILFARKATKQASNLINGRVKPSIKTALVELPKHLMKRKKLAMLSKQIDMDNLP